MRLAEKQIPRLKAEIRKDIHALKLSSAAKQLRSLKISQKIQKAHFFKNAGAVGFYAALKDEIDIIPVARKALEQGKKIFFPRMGGKGIEFRQVTDLERHLKPGRFGVLEPVLKLTPIRTRALDLILIPGRAFDKKGRRLGRGGGYYDRLLEKWGRSVRVGVAFREQLIKEVPFEDHDINMDIVVTA